MERPDVSAAVRAFPRADAAREESTPAYGC